MISVYRDEKYDDNKLFQEGLRFEFFIDKNIIRVYDIMGD